MQDGSSVDVLANSSKKDTSGDKFINFILNLYIIIMFSDDDNTPDVPTDNQDTKGNCY